MNINKKLYSGLYTDIVDLKKVNFIFNSISNYGVYNNKKNTDIEILEIGCGKGGISIPLAKSGFKIKSIEINSESAENLKIFANANKYNNLEILVADGLNYREDKLYDFVIISEVIEHVEQPGQLLLTCKIHLKREGKLLVTCPNGFGPWELKNRFSPFIKIKRNNKIRKLFGKDEFEIDADTHIQFFTIKKILELFNNHGFRVLKISNSDFLSIFPRLRKNRLFANIDINLANYIPRSFSNGWYFLLELSHTTN